MIEKSDLTPAVPDWFSQFYGPVRRFGERVAEFFSPSSDAARTKGHYEINMELPGVADNDIAIEVHDGRLTVSGEKRAEHEEKGKDFFFSERSYGRFQRIFRLPPDADEGAVEATHKDGVLSIVIAKAAPTQPDAKRVPINRA